jgi:hypothetical protein
MKQLLIAFFMIFGLSVHAFANDKALAVTPQQTVDLVKTQPEQRCTDYHYVPLGFFPR